MDLSSLSHHYALGMRAEIRDAEWRIQRVDHASDGGYVLACEGLPELVQGREALFLSQLEQINILAPETTALVDDTLQSIKDKTLRQRLTQTVAVRVLPQGAELLVVLSDRSESRTKLIDHIDGEVHDWLPGCTRYTSIHLGGASDTSRQFDSESGGLWIRQRGVDKTDLVSGQIKLPTHLEEKEPVSSLNHACTLLSQHHERHRISHTMNVYRRVFYREERGGKSLWYPLDDLRQGVVAEAERHIIVQAWRELESRLGFRPFGVPTQEKRRKNS